MAQRKLETQILTIMFVDIVGYTKTTSELSRESFCQLHDVFDTISLEVFEQFGGKVIKKIGDAFLITFTSPTDAVLCGMELQKRFKMYNKEYYLKKPLRIRVALHSGEVVLRNNDVYGEAVNVAARIEGVADADQVVFSEAVCSAMNKNEIKAIPLGEHRFKGVKCTMRIFRVRTKHDDIILEKRLKQKRFQRFKDKVKLIILLIFLFGLVVGLLWIFFVYFAPEVLSQFMAVFKLLKF